MAEKSCQKVVLLGAMESGKTSLVERLMNEWWKADCTTTIGTAFGAKDVMVRGRVVRIGMWDTAGQERFEVMTKLYYREAKVAMVCYDLSTVESFEKVKFWVGELKENAPDCAIFIVGTKLDLISGDGATKRRAVPKDTVTMFAASANATVMETSAKTAEGTAELLEAVATDILRRGATSTPVSNAANVSLLDKRDKREASGGGGGGGGFWSWC